MRILAMGAIAMLLLFSPDALACESDSDCPATSRCVKRFGELYGACSRGVAPIHGDERRRGDDQYSPKHILGEGCEFDSDCVSGLHCIEQPRSMRRTCSY